jgi:adenosylmethionine-8-amino-7-oxononanoate aminotransferase
MWAVEFVQDRKTKAPIARSEKFVERFTEAAFQNGVILWHNVGHVDGANGDLVMIAPPFSVSDEEIADFINRFKKSLEQVI